MRSCDATREEAMHARSAATSEATSGPSMEWEWLPGLQPGLASPSVACGFLEYGSTTNTSLRARQHRRSFLRRGRRASGRRRSTSTIRCQRKFRSPSVSLPEGGRPVAAPDRSGLDLGPPQTSLTIPPVVNGPQRTMSRPSARCSRPRGRCPTSGEPRPRSRNAGCFCRG